MAFQLNQQLSVVNRNRSSLDNERKYASCSRLIMVNSPVACMPMHQFGVNVINDQDGAFQWKFMHPA